MNGQRQSGFETASIGALLIVFALSLLISWMTDDWWLFVPVFLLGAGGFYLVLGAVMRPGEVGGRPTRMNSPFYVFWGATMFIVGAMWLLNMQYPGSFPLLAVAFIVWIGIFIVFLSLRKSKGTA